MHLLQNIIPLFNLRLLKLLKSLLLIPLLIKHNILLQNQLLTKLKQRRVLNNLRLIKSLFQIQILKVKVINKAINRALIIRYREYFLCNLIHNLWFKQAFFFIIFNRNKANRRILNNLTF